MDDREAILITPRALPGVPLFSILQVWVKGPSSVHLHLACCSTCHYDTELLSLGISLLNQESCLSHLPRDGTWESNNSGFESWHCHLPPTWWLASTSKLQFPLCKVGIWDCIHLTWALTNSHSWHSGVPVGARHLSKSLCLKFLNWGHLYGVWSQWMAQCKGSYLFYSQFPASHPA